MPKQPLALLKAPEDAATTPPTPPEKKKIQKASWQECRHKETSETSCSNKSSIHTEKRGCFVKRGKVAPNSNKAKRLKISVCVRVCARTSVCVFILCFLLDLFNCIRSVATAGCCLLPGQALSREFLFSKRPEIT